MKLNIPIDDIAWNLFRNFGIAIVIIILFSFLLAYNLKLRKKKELPVTLEHKLMTILVIIGINVFLVLYGSTLYDDVLYAVDVKRERIVSNEITIVEIDYYRHSCEVYDNDEKYLIRNYDYMVLEYFDIYEELKENYLMKKCEVEYFEESKRIISITLLE